MSVWNAMTCQTTRILAERDHVARPRMGLGVLGAIALVGVVATMSGCSRPAPEVRLQETGEALDSVANDLESLGTEIQRLEKQLAKQRKQRRKLVEEKLTLEERLERRATDVALFRAVQTKLLNSQKLQANAITVVAQSREITLEGVVESSEKEAIAVSIAQSVAGVSDVTSQLDVDSPAKEGAGPAAAQRQ